MGAPAPEFATNVEALIVRRRTAFKHACFTDGAGARVGLPRRRRTQRGFAAGMDAPAPEFSASAIRRRAPTDAAARCSSSILAASAASMALLVHVHGGRASEVATERTAPVFSRPAQDL
jgi:hypothetical protein